MKFLGREIRVRTHACGVNGLSGEPIKPMVKIDVKVTNRCNARCAFCSNGAHREEVDFDLDKFIAILKAFEASDVKLLRVCFTGGEPSCAYQTVEAILEEMSCRELRAVPAFLSSNGLSESARQLMRHPRLDSVTMSLHHYDLAKLAEIYGLSSPIAPFANLGVKRSKFSASCNLIKGYIDSVEEVKTMMDYALELGCGEIGFMALRDVSEFCRERFVAIGDPELEQLDHLKFIKCHSFSGGCRCSNYLYTSGEKKLSVYFRGVFDSNRSDSILMYDGAYLRQGFGEENVIV